MTARDQIRAMLDQLMGSDTGMFKKTPQIYFQKQLDRKFLFLFQFFCVKQIVAPCFSLHLRRRESIFH